MLVLPWLFPSVLLAAHSVSLVGVREVLWFDAGVVVVMYVPHQCGGYGLSEFEKSKSEIPERRGSIDPISEGEYKKRLTGLVQGHGGEALEILKVVLHELRSSPTKSTAPNAYLSNMSQDLYSRLSFFLDYISSLKGKLRIEQLEEMIENYRKNNPSCHLDNVDGELSYPDKEQPDYYGLLLYYSSALYMANLFNTLKSNNFNLHIVMLMEVTISLILLLTLSISVIAPSRVALDPNESRIMRIIVYTMAVLPPISLVIALSITEHMIKKVMRTFEKFESFHDEMSGRVLSCTTPELFDIRSKYRDKGLSFTEALVHEGKALIYELYCSRLEVAFQLAAVAIGVITLVANIDDNANISKDTQNLLAILQCVAAVLLEAGFQFRIIKSAIRKGINAHRKNTQSGASVGYSKNIKQYNLPVPKKLICGSLIFILSVTCNTLGQILLGYIIDGRKGTPREVLGNFLIYLGMLLSIVATLSMLSIINLESRRMMHTHTLDVAKYLAAHKQEAYTAEHKQRIMHLISEEIVLPMNRGKITHHSVTQIENSGSSPYFQAC